MLEERRDLGSGVGFDYEASEAVFSSIEQPELPRQDNAYDEGDAAYLTGIRLLLVGALDMTIIATAVPYITDDFHSVGQIGWYGLAYLITVAAFQGFWGKSYKSVSLKGTILVCISVFEVGNLICGLAPNSIVLIVGRAITGVGASGMFGGCYIIIAYIIPKRSRPMYIGLFSAMYSITSVIGPLLGSAFTEKVSWRWCFYINLPVGVPSMVVLFFLFKEPARNKTQVSWREVVLQMDLPGTLTMTAVLALLTLALEWAGVTRSWRSGAVVGTLVASAVLLAAFITLQIVQKERAFMIVRLVQSRTTIALCAFVFFLNAATFQMFYYLPVYFQSVRGSSPAKSGLQNLPLILSLSLAIPASTTVVTYFGCRRAFLVAGSVLISVGAGLIYTIEYDLNAGKWIGYQILFGAGEGLSVQMPMLWSQASCDPSDISSMTTIIMSLVWRDWGFCCAEHIYQRLIKHSHKELPQLGAAEILAVGASDLRCAFSGETLSGVVDSYMAGLKAAWLLGLILATLTFVAAVPTFNRGIFPGRKRQGSISK